MEFGEVEEPIPDGSVASSTMPQKRNPKLCMVRVSQSKNGNGIDALAFTHTSHVLLLPVYMCVPIGNHCVGN